MTSPTTTTTAAEFHLPRHGPLLAKLAGLLCDRLPSLKDCPSPFRLDHEAPMPLQDFGKRLEDYFSCSPSCFATAAAYLVRVKSVRPDIFDWYSAHKLMLAALTVAVKFSDDVVCKQDHYAKCGGIDKAELSHLERTMFMLLDFNACISVEEFNGAVRVLKSMRAIRVKTPTAAEKDDQSAVVKPAMHPVVEKHVETYIPVHTRTSV